MFETPILASWGFRNIYGCLRQHEFEYLNQNGPMAS